MPRRMLRDLRVEDLLMTITDRLRRLEHRTSAVIGSGADAYVIEVDASGRLVARHARTGTVTVLASP